MKKIKNKMIAEITDYELINYWLLSGWSNLMSYPEYKKRCKNNGTKIINERTVCNMNTNEKMLNMARKIVVDYYNSHVAPTDSYAISNDDVYIVWFSKTLQNWKALVSTNVPDGMYYEITHNGDKSETYVDVYKKWENYKVID